MSFNLVDLIKDQVGDQVLGQISNAIGENSDKTQSVVEGAIPALLGGFVDKASSSEGAGALFDAVNGQDDSILDNLSGMIGSDNKSSLIESGGSALGSLFGSSGASDLISAVSCSSGMSAGGTSTVVSMLAPMVMGAIKRFMSGGDSNDASGLATMLTSQKDNIAGAMPSGLADQLGSSGFMSNIGSLLGGGAGVAGLAESASGALSGAAGGLGDMATGAVGDITGKVGDMAGGAVDGVTGKVGDIAGGAVDGVAGVIGGVADGVTGAVSGATGKVGDMAGGAVDGVTGAISGAADGAAGKVGDLAGNVADGASNLAGSAAGAVGGVAGSISSATGDVASTGSSWIKKLLIPLVLAVLAFFGWKQFGGSAPNTSAVSDAASSTIEKVSGTVDSAASAVSGMVGGDMAANIAGLFGSATESLGSITDVESAKAAIPTLTDFSGKLDGITSMTDKLPDATKPILAGAVEKVMPMLDTVMAIPGVGAVLGSVIEPLKEKLGGLAG